MPAVLSVSQINRYISSKLRGDMKLRGIVIKGEISNLRRNFHSGHIYFTLTDGQSALRAVMFASAASNLKIQPSDGMNVMAIGNIDCYERDGVYQLIVTEIQPLGLGVSADVLEKLKEKLRKMGCFDQSRKKEIPYMPKTIGIVTSATGAALQDILNIFRRRFPLVKAYVFPALVQGDNALTSLVNALSAADQFGADTIILARGGGSAEDLSVFNSEKLTLAVSHAKTPIISAVGHETDITLCDLAADLRAPTPSAAAELAVPDIKDIIKEVFNKQEALKKLMMSKAESLEKTCDLLCEKLYLCSPEKRLELSAMALKADIEKLDSIIEMKCEKAENSFAAAVSLLESCSPLGVLKRGYSLVTKNEVLLSKKEDAAKGDKINIKFNDFNLDAEVIAVNEEK